MNETGSRFIKTILIIYHKIDDIKCNEILSQQNTIYYLDYFLSDGDSEFIFLLLTFFFMTHIQILVELLRWNLTVKS